jgi:hypothetical protein
VRFARWRDDLERALTTWSAEAEVRQVRSARRMRRWELVVLVVWLAILALFPVVVLQEPAALLRPDAVVGSRSARTHGQAVGKRQAWRLTEIGVWSGLGNRRASAPGSGDHLDGRRLWDYSIS